VYDTALWRKVLRPKILARANHRCEVPLPTGRICGRPAKAVDHVIPFSEGGAPFDERNLRAACTSCNTRLRNMRRAALARRQLGEADPRTPRTPTPGVTSLEW
jgi:5-methylcytosine-specific restriction endonuclease McrA